MTAPTEPDPAESAIKRQRSIALAQLDNKVAESARPGGGAMKRAGLQEALSLSKAGFGGKIASLQPYNGPSTV